MKKACTRYRPRWKRRPEARPNEIASAALDVFAGKGYETATLEEVAKQAGISKGTIYLYYPNKEHLLAACVEKHMTESLEHLDAFFDSWEANITKTTIRQRLIKILNTFMEILGNEKSRKAIKLVLAERQKSKLLREKHKRRVLEVYRKLAEFLRKADEAGAIDCPKPIEMARALLGFIVIFPVAEEMLGVPKGALKSKHTREHLIEFALRGLGL